MKFKVYYFDLAPCKAELELIDRFIDWQGCTSEMIRDPAMVANLGKGKTQIVVTCHGAVITGFKDLLKYFETNGLWLC